MTKSDVDRAKQRIRRRLAAQLLEVAQTLRSLHRDSLGESYPPASKPGEYPRKRSGRLQASVDYEPKSLDEIAQTLSCRVFYNGGAPYAPYLSGSGRLSIAATSARNRAQLATVFQKGSTR